MPFDLGNPLFDFIHAKATSAAAAAAADPGPGGKNTAVEGAAPGVPPLNEKSTEVDVKKVLEQWLQENPFSDEELDKTQFEDLKECSASILLKFTEIQLCALLGPGAGFALHNFLHPGMKQSLGHMISYKCHSGWGFIHYRFKFFFVSLLFLSLLCHS